MGKSAVHNFGFAPFDFRKKAEGDAPQKRDTQKPDQRKLAVSATRSFVNAMLNLIKQRRAKLEQCGKDSPIKIAARLSKEIKDIKTDISYQAVLTPIPPRTGYTDIPGRDNKLREHLRRERVQKEKFDAKCEKEREEWKNTPCPHCKRVKDDKLKNCNG